MIRNSRGRRIGQGSRRIDARNQASPEVAAGMRGIHRGMDGSVIGGYEANGKPVGTKAGASPAIFPGLRRWKQLNPGMKASTEKAPSEVGRSVRRSEGGVLPGGETRAAGGSTLAKRKKLFADMQKAGSGALGTPLRQRAAQLGITQAGWNRATRKIQPAPMMVANPAGRPKAPAITKPPVMLSGGLPKSRRRNRTVAQG